ncbi:unnamed protein product [Kuraishia capsulata CBS 1993]|uniref:rRNA methyltransferase 2, mitochondrial n=1 Tax=Kuraishia capsulata CBS 1993 TaxID=1382522 RepID=W6MJE2_9ASCO|nr:uncharacterized protein KUCA_T00000508001 [Kuraishia capsulata CBS 1993]CDK24542.1 unnamed protein product [Kuraishia capsulata CBS 1993]
MFMRTTVGITPMVLSQHKFGVLRIFSRSYAKSKSSKLWLDRSKKDPYTREAKMQNLKSRAAFKLLQLDVKFKLFEKGQNVVDLGYAPGAWSQVAYERSKGTVLGVDILPCVPPPGVSSIQGNILSKATQDRIRQHFNAERRKSDKGILVESSEMSSQALVSTESYLEREMTSQEGNVGNKFPIDLVLSDMCAPFTLFSGFSSMTTNMPYFRMANTSGLVVKDHQMSLDLCDAALILAIDMLRPGGAFVCKFFTGAEDKLLEKRLEKTFDKVWRFKPPASRDKSRECYFICKGKRENIDKLEVFQTT